MQVGFNVKNYHLNFKTGNIMKKALITGITGQCGSYLAELLLEKGYEVHGIVRRVASDRMWRIQHIINKLKLHRGDLTNYVSIHDIVEMVKPDELYHYGAQSDVGWSFKDGFSTFDVNINGTYYVLQAIRKLKSDCKVYFSGSSEMIGIACKEKQAETLKFYPVSPYAISKVTGFHLARMFRKTYGMFISCGIMFNTESPRRGLEFVTRKISYNVAKIKCGISKELKLGNVESKRDWSFAGDAVKAHWLMLGHDKADDFIIATGKVNSVKDFCKIAFGHVNLDYKKYVISDEEFKRPSDVEYLCGDSTKARKELGWKAEIDFQELVEMMVDEDLKKIKKGNGYGHERRKENKK